MKKDTQIKAKERHFISFYPDEEAQGGVFRQTLTVDTNNFDLVLKKAKKIGKELKAKSFVIFQMKMPRILTGYEEVKDKLKLTPLKIK